MEDEGFFAGLFDFSFSRFVTLRVIRVLYALAVLAAAVAALVTLGACSRGGVGGVLVGLILAVVVFFVYVLIARVWLEVIAVLFRIAENTTVLAEKARRERGEGEPQT